MEDYKELIKRWKEISQGLEDEESKARVDELISQLESIEDTEDNEDSLANLSSELSSVLQEVAPSLQARIDGQEKKDKFISDISDLVNVASGISDSIIANKQISQGERSLESSTPNIPQRKFKRSDELARRIRETRNQGSLSSVDRQTSGLRQEIEDQYLSDVNRASSVSGGQSSSFGALSQVAANNRIRNLMKLQGVKQDIRNQNERNLNFLTSQGISENQAADVSERARAEADRLRYNREQQAAGNLIQAGNINKRTARNQLLSALPSISGKLFDVSRNNSGQGDYEVNPNTGIVVEPRYSFDSDDDIFNYSNSLNLRY